MSLMATMQLLHQLITCRTDDDTEENRIIGPHARRQPGRPKVNRIKSGVEGQFGAKRAKRCSRCGGLGHAVTTCDATI